jgi:hypothetical protein
MTRDALIQWIDDHTDEMIRDFQALLRTAERAQRGAAAQARRSARACATRWMSPSAWASGSG